jgi:hypothetical protein
VHGHAVTAPDITLDVSKDELLAGVAEGRAAVETERVWA